MMGMDGKVGDGVQWLVGWLKSWGAWAARGADGGVGWGKESPMFRERVGGGVYRSVDLWRPSDEEMQQMDKIVRGMPEDLRLVCLAYYRDCGCNGRKVGRVRGMAVSSVQRKLVQVHDFIGKRLDEREDVGQYRA